MIEEVPSVVPLARPGVIEALEKALAAARAGQVEAVAIAIVGRDYSNWAEYCLGAAPIGMLMGSVERMRHKLNLEFDGA